ncbi:MAG: ATP-dependent helicase [Candidatus Cloacimonetes bacterium]|nr:ATP-dependent helicase [Candidatus Cloacimonadota bacterium]
MARLFGKEFHEHSNTWYFKSVIREFAKEDLIFRKYLDEKGQVLFRFSARGETQNFPARLDIVYSREKQAIISHHCSEDGEEICRHYLSVLNHAYRNYSTEILEQDVVQTYQTKLLEYNEYWQKTVLNGRIEIGDIYNLKNNKIRFYFKGYKPFDIRLIAMIAAGRDLKEERDESVDLSRKQMKALSTAELQLLALLQHHKCSYSRKSSYFTIYKSNFINLIEILRSLQGKVFILETGEKMEFPGEEFRINFQVLREGEKDFRLVVSRGEFISAAFVGPTSYFFKNNRVYSLNLPFNQEVTRSILAEGYKLQETDLVYLSSIVARQLGLIKCYIDFAEDIEFPEVYHNTPQITFNLWKEKDSIHMQGILDYGQEITIPMSVIRFPAELVRYDQEGIVSWFYIPPQVKYQIYDFIEKLPQSDTSLLEEGSVLIFLGAEDIEALKKTIFEEASQEWAVNLSDELKREFIYKVNLQPLIRARQSREINWFEYEVKYNYHDINFTHAELKKFFSSREKFLKLADGRLLFFENKEAFQKVENLLQQSEKSPGGSYRLSVYNIPFLYQLHSITDGIKVQGDRYLEELFQSIIQRRLAKSVQVADFLQPVMRTYQKTGYYWLKMLEYYGLSGILADDMGLGKTLQAISVLSDLPSGLTSMVICPKTLLFNWAAEIEKFNRNLSFVIYEGNQAERQRILDNLNVQVLLASYSIIQNDITELSKLQLEYVILDEAQHIKNAGALRSRAVKKLNAKHKLCLSGTPIENNPAELWSIMDFLMAGYLPSLRKFKNEFMGPSPDKDSQEKLKAMISPFILRRKKQEVLIELPDKQEQISYCRLTELQEKMYLQILENVRYNLLREQADFNLNYMNILAALTRMRQICNHPHLVMESIHPRLEYSGKLELLREIITDAIENDKKLLVFSQFVQMLKLLQKLMKETRIPYEYMDGTTRNRQQRIDNFNNNSGIRAFLISLKTGGFGLNLTAADTVILVDPWWNPMGESQAVDRAHRIGQTKKVMVYKIITKGTIEEKILQLQQTKREMFENLIDDGQHIFKTLSAEQLRELLEY